MPPQAQPAPPAPQPPNDGWLALPRDGSLTPTIPGRDSSLPRLAPWQPGQDGLALPGHEGLELSSAVLTEVFEDGHFRMLAPTWFRVAEVHEFTDDRKVHEDRRTS